jgi:DNA polymerase I-like protein with 3'-5' exonuclease and polymerase domains
MSLFFDEPLVKRKDARLRVLPPTPETGWRPPSEFPNLSAAHVISFDTETKDLRLDDNGPGWARRDSHIVGISIGAQARDGTRGSWYFPIRHELDTHLNMDVNNVLGFTQSVLNTPTDKVGANLTYDVGTLLQEGVRVGGRLYDVQFAEALIDSDAYVSLDHLARKYLMTGKVTEVLYNWIRQAYPNTPETKLRREIHRTSPKLVGHYGEADAYQPIDIWNQQQHIIWSEGLYDVFRLECDLIPLMVAMRMRGVRVDLEKAEKLHAELKLEIAELYERIKWEYGYDLKSTDSRQLGPFLASLQIPVPRNDPTANNPEGSYSVKKEWLAALEHPVGKLLGDIREREKIVGTFLEGYIFRQHIGGYLFPQFHQLKGDENGTMVGRFASSDPNLQNIPSRTLLGKRVRECFVHDLGHHCWRKFDFSQIHYRLLANYAVDYGDGSAEALRERYRNDPKTDYHMDVYKNVAVFMNWSLTDEAEIKIKRRPIKNVNFGLLYGQSENSLAFKAGFSAAQAKEFFGSYHKGAPYVKATMEAIGQEVQTYGYVTTLLGRRIRFNLWEPVNRNWDEEMTPLPYNAAIAKWGAGIKRAFEYRGVNYKFQGSEPDIMKSAMRACWNSGVYNVTGVPSITVHDELDHSVIDDSPQQREAYDFIKHTMENTVKIRVPIFADESNGPSWGKAD